MAISVLYIDIRLDPPILKKIVLDWGNGMTAEKAVMATLGDEILGQLQNDLSYDNDCLIVSWLNKETGEHSEVGGLGDLEWLIPDNSILSIVYEDEQASEEIKDLSNEWMLRNY